MFQVDLRRFVVVGEDADFAAGDVGIVPANMAH